MNWLRKNAGQVVMMGCYLLMGACCGVITAQTTDRMNGSFFDSLLLLLAGVYGSLLLHIVLHEAGHMVFGLMTGYKFCSFRIGPFVWQKDDEGRLRFGRSPLAGAAGQCLMDPPELTDGRMPFVLYNLGGGLMNVIFALIALVLSVLTENPAADALLLTCALTGVVLAFTNLLPMRVGALDNDGRNILSMKRNSEAVRALWLQLKIAALNAKGVRLKDMPEEWFSLPSRAAMGNSLCAAVRVFRCNRLMDEMKFDEARGAMLNMLRLNTGIAGLHRAFLLMDLACCELFLGNGQDAAKAQMDKDAHKIMKAMKNHLSVLRTEYILALRGEGNAEKAAAIEARFEKAAAAWPSKADVESERAILEYAKALPERSADAGF